jgi:hypothetical protein
VELSRRFFGENERATALISLRATRPAITANRGKLLRFNHEEIKKLKIAVVPALIDCTRSRVAHSHQHICFSSRSRVNQAAHNNVFINSDNLMTKFSPSFFFTHQISLHSPSLLPVMIRAAIDLLNSMKDKKEQEREMKPSE